MSIGVGASFLRLVAAACLALAASAPAAAKAPAVFALTDDEQSWIKQHPVLRVSVLRELEPIEYLQDGNLHGLSAEFLDEITRKTGLRFVYLPADTSQQRVDMVTSGEADLISAMRVNGDVAARSGFLHTDPYHISAGIVITRVKKPFLFEPDQLNGMTVTLPYLDRYRDELRRKAPDARLINGGSSRVMLDQVASGQADAAVGTEAFLVPYLYRGYQGQLQISGVLSAMTTEIGMSVRADRPVLHGILQKALGSISPEDIRRMHEHWLDEHMYEDPTFADIARHFWHELVLAGLVLVLLAGLAGVAYRMRLKAERNEREKTMFLAVMSHEIRSPMNSVLAAVELLCNTPLDKQQRHYAELANHGAQSLLTLIDDVLDVTKLEAGQVKLEPEPVNIATLVRNVVDLHQLRARERHISLSYDGDPEPPLLMLDEARLGQVLNNLVSNAIKFTESGGVTVRYAIQDSDIPRHRELRLSVSDTGIGIPEDAQAKLFLPYAQAARSFKRSGGTGLGLAITRDLVVLMLGKIAVVSKPGAGTTVDVSLPVLAAPRNAVVAEPVARQPAGARPAHGLRVLVVEDTPANQAVLQAQLEGFGCTAVIAQDGVQALACFAQGVYDLVLMDCDLPDQDGYALTMRLRLMEREAGHSRCPIIAISASTGAEHTARCFDADMDGILGKPIRMRKLQDAIELWCGVELDPIAQPVQGRGMFGPEQVVEALQRDLHVLLELAALRDADGARRAAHRLHGAALTVEWPEVARPAATLERMLADAQPWGQPAWDEQLQALAKAFRDSRPLLSPDADAALAAAPGAP